MKWLVVGAAGVVCILTGCSSQTLVPAQEPVVIGEVCITPDNSNWDEGTKNGPDKSALLGHNFVYQETKPHGFYSSYFHQRISS